MCLELILEKTSWHELNCSMFLNYLLFDYPLMGREPSSWTGVRL